MDGNWLIQYPAWELGPYGGGLLIALIATLHVYVAHFAVGGGLFLVLTEMKGYREKSRDVLEYTRKHTRFFLLLTVVFGSLSGVGIWFVISVLSPAATSTLIHYFVFGWATEWVFFMGEIVTIFVYYYTFGKMRPRAHLIVGWLYFIFGWLSLFVINGIVAYMLTPGQWIETQYFWDGFFNPSFWPSLFFRTFIAFMLAGLFGYLTAVHLKDKQFRDKMVRYCSWWLILPLLFLTEAGWWYLNSLPEPQKQMILARSPEILPFIQAFVWITPLIFLAGILMALRLSQGSKKAIAYGLLVVGFLYFGSFEWIREAGRRPYIVHDYLYSNEARAGDLDAIREQGLLKTARWMRHRQITDQNRSQVGAAIFRTLCLSCHSVGGPMNDILPITERFSVFGMNAMLDGMGKIHPYMPRFAGTPQERQVLAEYIVRDLHGKTEPPPPPEPEKRAEQEAPAFDPETDEYLLMAWTKSGMRFVSDCDARFRLSDPGTTVYAQLIWRGELPEKVFDEVIVKYQLAGESKPPIAGEMTFDPDLGAFVAKDLPVLPYPNAQTFDPYPLMTVTAESTDGQTLAQTRITAPVSTEMNCKTCHGGGWKTADQAGISDATAQGILADHDQAYRTDLLASAKNGKPRACQDCHDNLSASIHGFHANYLSGLGDASCANCHPKSTERYTRGLRGIHWQWAFECTNCHGSLEDHALSLLKQAKEDGEDLDHLMDHLSPRGVEDMAELAPRTPWRDMPDCLRCHVEFGPPETDVAPPTQWAAPYHQRTDDLGLYCAGCHNSAHAIWPASNIYQDGRDNLPAMQYQKEPFPIGANKNCKVCHTIDMEFEAHHPNSWRMFRNVQ